MAIGSDGESGGVCPGKWKYNYKTGNCVKEASYKCPKGRYMPYQGHCRKVVLKKPVCPKNTRPISVIAKCFGEIKLKCKKGFTRKGTNCYRRSAVVCPKAYKYKKSGKGIDKCKHVRDRNKPDKNVYCKNGKINIDFTVSRSDERKYGQSGPGVEPNRHQDVCEENVKPYY